MKNMVSVILITGKFADGGLFRDYKCVVGSTKPVVGINDDDIFYYFEDMNDVAQYMFTNDNEFTISKISI